MAALSRHKIMIVRRVSTHPSRELDNSVAIQWQSVVVSRQPVSAEWPIAAPPASPRRYARAEALRYLGEHVDKTFAGGGPEGRYRVEGQKRRIRIPRRTFSNSPRGH